jgi:hypothetical protein
LPALSNSNEKRKALKEDFHLAGNSLWYQVDAIIFIMTLL